MKSTIRAVLLVAAAAILSGCAFSSEPSVADDAAYAEMIRRYPREMQARGFADENLNYHATSIHRENFGDILARRLSPDFLANEKGHDVYLGETFRRSLTPMSRLTMDRDARGFVIRHPSQTLSMRMLAVLDWNHDGDDEWLTRCRIESYRGGRVRDYYLLVPIPDAKHAVVHATVLGTADSAGLGLPPIVNLRDTSSLGAKEMPETEVHDVRPGQSVTAPPSAAPKQEGLVERSL